LKRKVSLRHGVIALWRPWQQTQPHIKRKYNITKPITVLICFTSLWFVTAVPKQQPNVLLISIDTLRADHLGCYGYPTATPSIDRLAAQSIVFENAISQVPLTLPSHSTLLTGLFPGQHGVRNNENFVLPSRVTTLAEHLQKNGYATGAVAGSFSLDSIFGISQGFQFYEDAIGKGHDPEVNRNSERRAESVWNLGQGWLEKQKSPWFCFLHFFDPHAAYAPPKPYPQSYDGEIAYTDHVIGSILEFLINNKLYSTTIIVLLSDHGESLGEHGEMSHGVFLYDATLKVPFLICAPRLKPIRIRSQVRLADVAPTIADLAGYPMSIPGGGQSLVPYVKGDRNELPAYSETY
jgi:arylsulfatase A-like enzyme